MFIRFAGFVRATVVSKPKKMWRLGNKDGIASNSLSPMKKKHHTAEALTEN